MNINTSLISNNNSYAGQTPKYIVIHNTDNYSKGANAKAHAKAQHDGNFKGYSAMYLLMTQKHTRPFRMTEALGTLESTMAAVCSEQ